MSPVTPLFLLSLPRSGSTLLQRILAGHPAIATVPEPWLLLSPVYALRAEGVRAEYDHRQSVTALEDFCARLPNGTSDYHRAVAEMATQLYGSLTGPDQQYFLDKTPRYHLIAEDLARIFPKARFLVLWRNPLAVAASMLNTWHGGKWLPDRYALDLRTGLGRLTDFVDRREGQVETLRYEDLIAAPEARTRHVCEWLGLDFREGMLSGLDQALPAGRMGDPAGEGRSGVEPGPEDGWEGTFRGFLRKRWARGYLREVGKERLLAMGYDPEGLLSRIDALSDWSPTLPADGLRSVLKGTREPLR